MEKWGSKHLESRTISGAHDHDQCPEVSGGRAADALLAMGTDVRVQQILDKFDVRFGDVCPTDMTLEKFFTARQLPTESMSAWGCRLEDIVSRIRDPGSAASAHSMSRTRYWTGIYSDKIRNALCHHFDDGADFESLLRQACIAEQEPTSMPVQQRAVVPSNDKLDEILRQLKELTCRVTELEKRCLYPSSSPVPSHPLSGRQFWGSLTSCHWSFSRDWASPVSGQMLCLWSVRT